MRMKTFRIYFQTQVKRALKVCPAVIFATFLLCGSVCLVLGLFLETDASKENKQKMQIGVVGDISDSYLGFGIYALQHLDSSRFAIDFHNMSEEEARSRMESGELSAYVRIPDGFVDSVVNGENKPLTYVVSNGQTGVGAVIMNELVDTISGLITESQNAIYGMQKFMLDNETEADFWEATDELNIRYIDFILNRTDLYRLETVGISKDLSMAGYYLCGVLILFFLLWGISGCTLFAQKDKSLSKLLASKGRGADVQVFGEYLAYLLLMLLSLVGVAAVLVLAVCLTGFTVPEWEKAKLSESVIFILKQIPVALAISAFQFFLYELSDGIVGVVILQFLSAVCLGYLSGCLYPLNFFPESIQRLAAVLPTGAALSYADKTLLKRHAAGETILLLLYFTIFIGLSVLIRNRRLKGGDKG